MYGAVTASRVVSNRESRYPPDWNHSCRIVWFDKIPRGTVEKVVLTFIPKSDTKSQPTNQPTNLNNRKSQRKDFWWKKIGFCPKTKSFPAKKSTVESQTVLTERLLDFRSKRQETSTQGRSGWIRAQRPVVWSRAGIRSIFGNACACKLLARHILHGRSRTPLSLCTDLNSNAATCKVCSCCNLRWRVYTQPHQCTNPEQSCGSDTVFKHITGTKEWPEPTRRMKEETVHHEEQVTSVCVALFYSSISYTGSPKPFSIICGYFFKETHLCG